jgi:uncharacterized membrane protein
MIYFIYFLAGIGAYVVIRELLDYILNKWG